MHNKNPSKFLSRRNIQGDVTGGRTDTGTGGGGGGSATPVNLAVYCMYVTLTNYDLNGTETVDGESPSNGDRILVANQTDASENGIYIYNSSGAWTRATDLVPALQISILGGTKQGTIWVVETPTFEIGTDDISIIESAISRKDESFSLGFTPVASLMTSDIALFQVSSNEIQSATVQDIMDTYGARGLWDAVIIKESDQDYENSNTLTDVSELTIDLEADELYDFLFEVLASKIGTGYGGQAFIQVHYTGTFEDGVYNKPDYFNEYQEREINPSSSTGSDTLMNFFSKSRTPIAGRIKTTTAGTLKLKMAYNESPSVGLGWTVLNNSSLKVKKLDSFTNFQPSSGEANTGVNVGGEKEVYKSMSGTALQFRTLKEGTGITLTENTNDIEISASGGDITCKITSDVSVTGYDGYSADLGSVSLPIGTYTYSGCLILYSSDYQNRGLQCDVYNSGAGTLTVDGFWSLRGKTASTGTSIDTDRYKHVNGGAKITDVNISSGATTSFYGKLEVSGIAEVTSSDATLSIKIGKDNTDTSTVTIYKGSYINLKPQ